MLIKIRVIIAEIIACKSFLNRYFFFETTGGRIENTWRKADNPENDIANESKGRCKFPSAFLFSAMILQAEPISRKAEIKAINVLLCEKLLNRLTSEEKKII